MSTNHSVFDAASGSSHQPIFDYAVLDSSGDKIGKVQDVWPSADGSGFAYVGVHTGWFVGKRHVVPATGIQINHDEKTIQLPLSADRIKAAPDFEVTDEISGTDEQRIRGHYGDTTTDRTEADESGAVEIPLREEKLKVGTRQVDAGSIRLRRIVRTETVNVPVELHTDDVVIERVAGAAGASADEAIGEKDITIPLTREEAVVQKTTETTGVVRARKTVHSANESVQETLRKEDVAMDRDVAGESRTNR